MSFAGILPAIDEAVSALGDKARPQSRRARTKRMSLRILDRSF